MVYLIYLNNFWYNLVMLGAKASVHIILDQLFIIFLTHHKENLYVMWYFIVNGLLNGIMIWESIIWYMCGVAWLQGWVLVGNINSIIVTMNVGSENMVINGRNIYDIMNAMAFKMIICLKTTSVPANRFWKILLSFNQSNCGTVSKMIKDTWQIHYKSMFKKLIMFPIFLSQL